MSIAWIWGLVGVLVGCVSMWGAYRRHAARRGFLAFHGSELQTIVVAGLTDARGVRLWGRTMQPGTHRLELCVDGQRAEAVPVELVPEPRADGTFVFDYPQDVAEAAPLSPATRYRAALWAPDGRQLGRARFETAPESAAQAPARFALAALSCHLPFDKWGAPQERAHRVLRASAEWLEQQGVKRLLMMGDQVYGDLPETCSLFNSRYFRRIGPSGRRSILQCNRDQVRALYQQRHRLFWRGPEIQKLQSSFACSLIPDDHEIVDNFGTSPEHAAPAYRNLVAGAFDALYDYQAARVLGRQQPRPAAFYHQFEYGPLAVFVMDLRSERSASEEEICIFSPKQAEALAGFLNEHQAAHVVAVVLSVPLVHVPDWLAGIGVSVASPDGDLADRWSNPKARASRDQLLTLLREHQRRCPKQRLLILGGDVHVGFVSRLDWGEGIRNSYQLVSSALSNVEGFPLRRLIESFQNHPEVQLGDEVPLWARLLETDDQNMRSNPYGGLNLGLIEVERVASDESAVRLSLVGADEQGDLVRVFESDWL